MELSPLINDYLKYLETEKNVSPYTLKNYRHYLLNFLEFAKSKNISKMEDIDEELIQSFKLHLSKLTDSRTSTLFKKATQNYFLIALRNFIWYLSDHKKINTLRAMEIHLLKQEIKSPKTLDSETLASLLCAPLGDLPGLRDKAILSVLSATGMKISELALLNRGSFSFTNQTVAVPGKKERVLDIPSSTVGALEGYLRARKDPFKPLFIRFKGSIDSSSIGEHMRLTPRSIERMVKKYAQNLGLEMEVTPQVLRHSFALSLISDGEKLDTVQKVMGHTSKASTKVYEKLARENL